MSERGVGAYRTRTGKRLPTPSFPENRRGLFRPHPKKGEGGPTPGGGEVATWEVDLGDLCWPAWVPQGKMKTKKQVARPPWAPSPVPHHPRTDWGTRPSRWTVHSHLTVRPTLGRGGWEAPSPHPHPRDRQKKPREFPPARGWPPCSARGGSADKPTPRGKDFFAGPKTVPPPLRGARCGRRGSGRRGRIEPLPPRQGPCSPAGRGPGFCEDPRPPAAPAPWPPAARAPRPPANNLDARSCL